MRLVFLKLMRFGLVSLPVDPLMTLRGHRKNALNCCVKQQNSRSPGRSLLSRMTLALIHIREVKNTHNR